MKTFHTTSSRHALLAGLLFSLLTLNAPSLFAQTFAGRDYLAESPASIRAFIYADANKEAIKMRLENRSAKAVRIRILDEKQKPVYDDYVTKPAYYGRFNVSALPYGSYTIELSTQTAKHTQGFQIERPTAGRIVMATQPAEPDRLIAKNSLIINELP